MILFGFNDRQSKSNTSWQGFTFKWYQQLFAIDGLTDALVNSLLIAVVSTVLATVLGTLLGLAVGRYRFRGKGVTDFLIFAAISTPELVMGASLLSLFVSGNAPRGHITIIIAHTLFSLAFVVVTVRARVVGLDPSLEEAARDLGAGTWTTFRLVTLPSIMPGVAAGAMLAFALSIDDYVVTSFVNGSTADVPPVDHRRREGRHPAASERHGNPYLWLLAYCLPWSMPCPPEGRRPTKGREMCEPLRTAFLAPRRASAPVVPLRTPLAPPFFRQAWRATAARGRPRLAWPAQPGVSAAPT